VRRLLVVLFALFASSLAAPPLGASAQSVLSVKPSVMVYPFSANGSTLDREASSRLATIIATQMANTGRVAVIAAPPGTERKDYLTAARRAGADYYVAGFISPLGDGVSVVEQVVGTGSGIVLYSNTAQLATYADAAGQGDNLAQFVAVHANRGLAAIGTPPPAPSPSAQPTQAAQANLGKLFGRRRKATPTPKPSAKPAPAPLVSSAPAPVAAVPAPLNAASFRPSAAPAAAAAEGLAIVVAGSADALLRDAARERMVAVAAKAGTRAVAVSAPLAAIRAGDEAVCRESRVRDIAYATLDMQPGNNSAHVDLAIFDCAGRQRWHRAFDRDAGGAKSAQLAAQRAAGDALDAYYLHPPRRR
jgi:TolB-like protein